MNWAFWWELLLRSSGLLVFGEVLRRLSRARSAAFRYKLLLWVLLLLALLPVFSMVLPEVQLPFWPHAQPGLATVTVQEVSAAVLSSSVSRPVNWLLLLWFSGVLMASAPVVIGAILAYRVAGRAKPFPCDIPTEGAEILISSELSVPLTCGFWRPRILLPSFAEDWSPARLEAVLLHESAHVRRRDVAAQMTAHLLAALWWFQPLIWIFRKALRTESELACDAEALQSGFRPSAYAAELLAVAQSVGRDYPLSSCGISMARGSDLEHRVRVILDPAALASAHIKLARAKTFGLVVALATVALAASALTLQPDRSFSEQGGSIMKRTLISGLLTSVGLSAAVVSGTVHDPGGVAIPDATVLVFNPDSGARQQTTTDAEGKFSLAGSGAGQYILRVEKSGFAFGFPRV